MSLALSTYVLLISLMKSVNRAQLLDATFLPLFPPLAANSATVIAPLTKYMHHYNHINLTSTLKF